MQVQLYLSTQGKIPKYYQAMPWTSWLPLGKGVFIFEEKFTYMQLFAFEEEPFLLLIFMRNNISSQSCVGNKISGSIYLGKRGSTNSFLLLSKLLISNLRVRLPQPKLPRDLTLSILNEKNPLRASIPKEYLLDACYQQDTLPF